MPSARQASLRSSLESLPAGFRPILTSVNGDGTWLISLPLPSDQRQPHKHFYHVLTDPWLKGDASMLSSWFVNIARTTPTAAADGAGIDDIVREIEAAASRDLNEDASPAQDKATLDAIFVNFHYLDHMHQPTLLTFDPKIPVFAAKEAYTTIRSWGHFDHVFSQLDFEPDMDGGWQSAHPGGPLPKWLTVFRLTGDRELNFATVIVWSHADGDQPRQQKHESILLSPHGIKVDRPNLQALFGPASEPPLSSLAMLAALKDSFAFGTRTTLGVAGGLAVERYIKPKYWVRMADSHLTYRGLVMWLGWTNDIFRTLDDGLKEEAAAGKGVSRRPNLLDVESGNYLIMS